MRFIVAETRGVLRDEGKNPAVRGTEKAKNESLDCVCRVQTDARQLLFQGGPFVTRSKAKSSALNGGSISGGLVELGVGGYSTGAPNQKPRPEKLLAEMDHIENPSRRRSSITVPMLIADGRLRAHAGNGKPPRERCRPGAFYYLAAEHRQLVRTITVFAEGGRAAPFGPQSGRRTRDEACVFGRNTRSWFSSILGMAGRA